MVKTVVALEESTDIQHRNSSTNKVSPLELIKSDYFLTYKVNNHKTCLPENNSTNKFKYCFEGAGYPPKGTILV